MEIGVPKEIKDRENRVALTPEGAQQLAEDGHTVRVQSGAGAGSGFSDEAYARSGARLVDAAEAWDTQLVLKVKEPLQSEYAYLADQILFTYLHLAGVSEVLTETLLERGTTAIGYETVEDDSGRLPLLAPMSAVAGNMAVSIGSYYLARPNGGKGTLLGEVLGATHGKVVIIGDGVVGRHAARAAVGLGARTIIMGRHAERRAELQGAISSRLEFSLSEAQNIARELEDADLLIGAVLLRGGRAPRVVSEEMVRGMQTGSVIVDVSIDQGGCVETSHATSHSDPVFLAHEVIHYCVTNMPGAYPHTSTVALTSATLPYVRRLANEGLEVFRTDLGFAKGVNTRRGRLTCRAVAEALNRVERLEELSNLL